MAVQALDAGSTPEEARRLLATTTLKVSQVGSRVGYADPNYFITAFKKQEGVTPTEYRAGQTVRRLKFLQ